jgi:hypothetical protein
MTPCLARAAMLAIGLAACARDLPGEEPPDEAFYFPNGVASSPDGSHVYVVSSNFDQRYNAGWVGVVETERFADYAESGGDETDGVDDARDAIVQQLKIPSLGGDIALSPDGRVGVVAHRGSRLLTVFTISADFSELECGDRTSEEKKNQESELARTDCDPDNLVTIDVTDERWNGTMSEANSNDPYAVSLFERLDTSDTECAALAALDCTAAVGCTFVDSACQRRELLLAVGFLSYGRLLLYSVDIGGDEVLVPNRALALGTSGSGSIAAYPQQGSTRPYSNYLAATSREFGDNSELSTVYSVDVDRSISERRNRVSTIRLSSRVGGRELVDLVFNRDGSRAYASNNFPDSLLSFDTSLGGFQESLPDGGYQSVERPAFLLLASIPLEGQPAGLDFLRRDGGDLLATLSFTSDTLYVLEVAGDTLWSSFRVDDVGLGPFQAASVPVNGGEGSLLFMSTFFDHGLAVMHVPPVIESTRRIAHLIDAEIGDASDQR